MTFERDIDLEKLRAAENEAAYWKQMEVVAKKQTAYWKAKENAMALEIECWEFQTIEAEQNAKHATMHTKVYEARMKALEIIEGE